VGGGGEGRPTHTHNKHKLHAAIDLTSQTPVCFLSIFLFNFYSIHSVSSSKVFRVQVLGFRLPLSSSFHIFGYMFVYLFLFTMQAQYESLRLAFSYLFFIIIYHHLCFLFFCNAGRVRRFSSPFFLHSRRQRPAGQGVYDLNPKT